VFGLVFATRIRYDLDSTSHWVICY
jgi:hypothetical protein